MQPLPPLPRFCCARFAHHARLNLIRVVAVFAALQIINLVSIPFEAVPSPEEGGGVEEGGEEEGASGGGGLGSGFAPFGLFFVIVAFARAVLRRARHRPAYVWFAVAIFGHVAGFAYKACFLAQLRGLGWTRADATVWLGLPLLVLEAGALQLLLAARRSLTGATETTVPSLPAAAGQDGKLADARARMATLDIYKDAFANMVGYLLYAAVAGVFLTGPGAKAQLAALFELEEPPCLQHHAAHHQSTPAHEHNTTTPAAHPQLQLHQRRRLAEHHSTTPTANTSHHGNVYDEDDKAAAFAFPVVAFLAFLCCFLFLPVAEFWLHKWSRSLKVRSDYMFSQQQQRLKRAGFIGLIFHKAWRLSLASSMLGTVATAMPMTMAYQAHGLIVGGLEHVAEEGGGGEATLVWAIALSAVAGFFLSSVFPPCADTMQEKRNRQKHPQVLGGGHVRAGEKKEDRGHDGGDHHHGHAGSGDEGGDEAQGCTSLLYRSKMLAPSHKEMWAVWVGLLCEMAVACATSTLVEKGNVSKGVLSAVCAGLALLLYCGTTSCCCGQDFAATFEHHLREEMAEEAHEWEEEEEQERRGSELPSRAAIDIGHQGGGGGGGGGGAGGGGYEALTD
jgi:hypothetical protein